MGKKVAMVNKIQVLKVDQAPAQVCRPSPFVNHHFSDLTGPVTELQRH